MNSMIKAKSIFAGALEYSGRIGKWIASKSNSHFLILMYHRIIPYKEAGHGIQAGMYVDPETFEMHIRCLKKHFLVLPLSEIPAYMKCSNGKPSDRPACFLTFDDGWRDFYTYAYPVLIQHETPATVFLPTKFIGTINRFWTDSLIRLCCEREKGEGIRRGRTSSPSPVIDLLESTGCKLEIRLERGIETMKKMPEEEINQVLADLSARWGIDPTPRERDFLTWDEVQVMHRSGLVSFASHTDTHRILTTLEDGEIDEELRRSKNRLVEEGVVDPSFLPFAYPNGGYNEKIIGMVKQHGYSVAVTTRKGWVRCAEEGKEFELGRIGIHQDVASTDSLFGCRILQII